MDPRPREAQVHDTNDEESESLLPSSASQFEDKSVDCAICLEPLYHDTTVEGGDGKSVQSNQQRERTKNPRVVTLTCGHKWHYHCLAQQLQTAQPSSTKRLLFTGCQCAKCGVICDHEDLRDLTRTTDILRKKVDKLILEQIALDAPDIWKLARQEARVGNEESLKRTLNEARRKYAFYLCKHCKEPYFGGTVECADQMDADHYQERGQDREERLCVACTPLSQSICRNPLEHAGYLIWKCRYCCQPATHLCYGNVHFCDDCHDKNSQRVRDEQRSVRRTPRSARRPKLESSPCCGTSCPFPKPLRHNRSHHSNGGTFECEQVYGCAWCESSSNTAINSSNAFEAGSYNFIINPSGRHQLRGWKQLNPRMSWRVERADEHMRVNAVTDTNFVSSFMPCAMSQTMDLTNFLVEEASNVRVEVSARFMGRSDCPSVFRMEAILLDSDQRRLHQLATSTLEAPPDYWARTSLTFDAVSLSDGSHFLSVIVIGQDSRFWQGNFGSKVADIQVRVLGSEEEISRVLLNAERPPQDDTDDLSFGSRMRLGNRNADNTIDLQQSDRQPQGHGHFFDHLIILGVIASIVWHIIQQ